MAVVAKATRSVRYLRKGDQGLRGMYILPPMLWSDYDSSYVFTTGAKDPYALSVVLVQDGTKLKAYQCVKEHTKAASKQPGTTGADVYWKAFAMPNWTSIATGLLIAESAYVERLSVDGIKMYARDASGQPDRNKVVFEALEGNVACRTGTFENVTVSGRIMSGTVGGQRVEIDPDEKEVTVYDSAGQICTQLDGNLSSVAECTKAATTATFTAKTTATTLKIDNTSENMQATAKSGSLLTARVQVAKGGKLTAKLEGKLECANWPSLTSGSKTPTMQRQAMLHVYAAVYSTKDSATPIQTKLLGTLSILQPNQTSSSFASGTSHSVTLTKAGFVDIYAVLTATGKGTVNVTGLKLTAAPTFLADSYLSRFFANGFALMKNAANYLIGIWEGEKMQLRLGGDFYMDGIKQPKTVYAALVTVGLSNSKPTLSVTKLTGGAVTVAFNASRTDGFRVTLPSTLELAESNILVQATGYGKVLNDGSSAFTNNDCKASVGSFVKSGTTVTGVNIITSGNASGNWGGFFIQIMKM